MITDHQQPELFQRMLAGELRLLELLATGAPLMELLAAFVRSFEASFPEVICSVLLLDKEGLHLHHGAAPSLPQAYSDAIEGVEIGPVVGSCGTAAFTRQTVIAADIATSPLWHDFAQLALSHGLRSCWSTPIFSTQGRVLGTFANYRPQPSEPSTPELIAIQRSAYLLGLFIEHHQFAQHLARQQEALRDSEARYRTLIEWAPQAVAVHRNGRLIYVNAAAVQLLRGQAVGDIVGKQISDFLHPDDRQVALERAQQAMVQGNSLQLQEERLVRLDGSVALVEIQSKSIQYDGAPAVYVVAHDLSKRQEDEKTIHYLAFFDALTDLPNRRLLMDRLQQALLPSGEKQLFGALMLLDLDRFKDINDLMGHDIGDALLKQVAQRLRGCVRQNDSVARVGGDEFMVLLEPFARTAVDAAQYAETLASKIAVQLSRPYTLTDASYASTPSIGIVVFQEGADSRDDAVRKADAAMYQAKAAGRNTIRFFDPSMQAQALARIEFEQDMRQGLEQHEFVLHYQVQVNTQGEIIGAEALARWTSAKHGDVPPFKFIPLAEDNGMILPLGQFVLESACQQLVRWSQRPETVDWVVAVNVSARQFAQDTFVESVANVLRATGANPQRLKLELTESMLVKNMDAIIVKMNAVRALGASFSLDDFGTGYSSLSYLKKLPLAQLKIDQSFVRDLLTDPSDAAIARTVVALGHSLGMKVIAEGVETAEHCQVLTEMGCDAFQGYYFGRPVPAQDVPHLLNQITI
jgi:diguanylate cyclase (GGDEF)-like protein/PAS domain S-box-containing protein